MTNDQMPAAQGRSTVARDHAFDHFGFVIHPVHRFRSMTRLNGMPQAFVNSADIAGAIMW
jgi:hypothetical protein